MDEGGTVRTERVVGAGVDGDKAVGPSRQRDRGDRQASIRSSRPARVLQCLQGGDLGRVGSALPLNDRRQATATGVHMSS
ncbi:hypothetical protein PL81_38705 [Streptomyces sp. RSD-27]|nr:hypothetical protein PL81_38705 [Streptomyces sp. RSD-27]